MVVAGSVHNDALLLHERLALHRFPSPWTTTFRARPPKRSHFNTSDTQRLERATDALCRKTWIRLRQRAITITNGLTDSARSRCLTASCAAVGLRTRIVHLRWIAKFAEKTSFPGKLAGDL